MTLMLDLDLDVMVYLRTKSEVCVQKLEREQQGRHKRGNW